MLDLEVLNKLGEHLMGTCKSLSEGIEAFQETGEIPEDVDEEEIRGQLLDIAVSRCASCEWWVETGECEPNDQGEDVCEDCRDED